MRKNVCVKHIKTAEGSWVEGAGYNKKVLLGSDELNSAGTLVQLVVIPPHTTVARHFHRNATEVFHIISGNGHMNIAGQDVTNWEPSDSIWLE